MNKLFYGDNLTIMQSMPSKCVDLIYLDPPFNSKQNYNLMYKTMTGKPVPEQAEAFCDTWEMDAQKEEIAQNMPKIMLEHGIENYYIKFWELWIAALRNTQPHLLAYLIYMVQRLMYMKNILRPAGSIYLHCDPTASHYIKVMMDGIFGHQNFRNEIIWKRTFAHGGAKRWGPVHDVILFYSASEKYTWNKVTQKYDNKYLEDFYKYEDDKGRYQLITLTGAGVSRGESGKIWRGVDPSLSGRHWAVPQAALERCSRILGKHIFSLSIQEQLDILDQYGFISWPSKKSGKPRYKRYLDADAGMPIQDIINDINPISSHSNERLGYPTQKPLSLLERIILASSNVGDVVFDPFCGCGTTIYAAEKTSRKWIGCDIAILAVRLIKEILTEKYRLVENEHFKIDGIPVSVEQANDLFKKDPFQFQHWIIERSGGFPMQKKVADKGIDGRLYFETSRGSLKEMVLSVKGGNIHPSDIRDLRGVLNREKNAEIAGFLSLKEPTKAMREEASSAGLYEYMGTKYPRIQLLTVKDILEDKREFLTPTRIKSKISSGQASLPLSYST